MFSFFFKKKKENRKENTDVEPTHYRHTSMTLHGKHRFSFLFYSVLSPHLARCNFDFTREFLSLQQPTERNEMHHMTEISGGLKL